MNSFLVTNLFLRTFICKALFWDWLESSSAGRKAGLKRSRPSTHTNAVWKSLGYANTGVMTGESVGQSEFMWHCRKLPGVRRAYESVWGLEHSDNGTDDDTLSPGVGESSLSGPSSTTVPREEVSMDQAEIKRRRRQLVTSFDGCGVWRNWWLHGGQGSGTQTDGNWYATIDQP